jgi:zinc protease
MNNKSFCLLALAAWFSGCGASLPEKVVTPPPVIAPADVSDPRAADTGRKESPPASAVARDISFPKISHVVLPNGLTIDVVTQTQLPTINLELVIMTGGARDPKGLPGLANSVAEMLREGTKKKNAAQFAEAVEFLGANISSGAGNETTRVSMSALSEHLDAALALVAEAVLSPAFDAKELEKYKKRTLDDLKLKLDKPAWLGRRALQKELYGDHPYAQYDTTEEAVRKTKRDDLVRYHAANFAPNNAFLVVVGNVTPEQVEASAKKLFGTWKKKEVPALTYAPPPARTGRKIIVVDRPASVQSQIMLGNLALKRNDPSFVPLMVANQVLGGSAASRLFMDLREKRSLTYGAYSSVDETVDVGAFRSSAAVRNPVTGEALDALFENLSRIISEAPPAAELANAHRYLADSFPLQIETADRIADLVADLRIYGLPDNYWDGFRSSIRSVSSQEALAAAKAYIRPEHETVVVVGKAAEIVPMLQKHGPVEVVDIHGQPVKAKLEAANAAATPDEAGKSANEPAKAAGAKPAKAPKPAAPAGGKTP